MWVEAFPIVKIALLVGLVGYGLTFSSFLSWKQHANAN